MNVVSGPERRRAGGVRERLALHLAGGRAAAGVILGIDDAVGGGTLDGAAIVLKLWQKE